MYVINKDSIMSQDNVRKYLDERDIIILCKSCLTTLHEHIGREPLEIAKLYDLMGLNLEVVMLFIYENYLLHQTSQDCA